VDDYLCVTVKSRLGETADAFGKRLIDFWTGILRKWPDQYKRIYAESAGFGGADRLSRQYMIGMDVAGLMEKELAAADIEHDPIDADDVYSKYEATPPEWFQIPH
jgi:hypothetical protein